MCLKLNHNINITHHTMKWKNYKPQMKKVEKKKQNKTLGNERRWLSYQEFRKRITNYPK